MKTLFKFSESDLQVDGKGCELANCSWYAHAVGGMDNLQDHEKILGYDRFPRWNHNEIVELAKWEASVSKSCGLSVTSRSKHTYIGR